MQENAQPVSRTSRLAIASLAVVLGVPFAFGILTRVVPLPPLLSGFMALLAYPVGFVLALAALVQIRRSGGRLKGRGVAIAGLCVAVLIPVMVYPVFARARKSARMQVCQSNVESILLAVRMYAADNGVYPDAATWCDDIAPCLEGPWVFRCADAPNLNCAYAYNAALSGAPVDSVAPDVVTIFESDTGWNAAGSPQRMLPDRPRHFGGDNFGYAGMPTRWEPRPASAPSPTGAKR